jgi:hypothetical protein
VTGECLRACAWAGGTPCLAHQSVLRGTASTAKASLQQFTCFLNPLFKGELLVVRSNTIARTHWPGLESRRAAAKMRGDFVVVPASAKEGWPARIEGVGLQEHLHRVALFLVWIVNPVRERDVGEVSSLPPETHEKEQLAVRCTTTQPWEQLATLSDLLVFEPLVRHHGLIEVLHVRPHALASLHTWCASTRR